MSAQRIAMSRLIFVAGLAAGLFGLSACQEADGPAPVPAEPVPSAAPAVEAGETPSSLPPELTGRADASSSTAMSITGDVEFDGAAIRFGKGIELVTAPERIDLATAVYDVTGTTWAQLLQAEDDTQVELRRVTSQSVGEAGRDGGLCGAAEAGYVALLQEDNAVHMAVFAAGQSPGAAAPDTALCGTFLYHFGG